MRAIDADALIVQFRRAIETFLPNDPRRHMNPVDSLKCHGWEQGLMMIQNAPTIQPEPHEIGYDDCANALLKMWMDDVLTDGEYYRIADKLNKKWGKKEVTE